MLWFYLAWLLVYGFAFYWIYLPDPEYDAEGERQWSEFCERTRILEEQMGRRPLKRRRRTREWRRD